MIMNVANLNVKRFDVSMTFLIILQILVAGKLERILWIWIQIS